MSSVQVESSTMASRASQHLVDVDIHSIDQVPEYSFSNGPHGAVIDVDDDETLHQTVRRSTRNIPSRTVLDNGEIPRNRRRTRSGTHDNPVFVIDDTNDTNERTFNNGARNRPIVVSDSDDEYNPSVASGSGSQARRVTRRRNGRTSSFRIFSPSPIPQREPPIIADSLPFAILPPAPNNDNPAPRQPPNHMSRNGSGIQLGGGLMSHTFHSNRRRIPPFSLSSLGNLLRSVTSGAGASSSNASNTRRSVAAAWARSALQDGRFLGFSAIEQFFTNWDGRYHPDGVFEGAGERNGPWQRRNAALGLGPDYEPSMTHPGLSGPGWTFDIGSEDSSAGDGGAEILVCALCLDPLLSNAEGMIEVSDEERRDRRVWALRCGHVLDGKCVGRLMRPERVNDAVNVGGVKEKTQKVEGKGKGKEIVEEQEVADLVQLRDSKGKGKASATSPRAPSPPSHISVDDMLLAPAPQENSIRSRLRSYGRPSVLSEVPDSTIQIRRGRGTKRKREPDSNVEAEVSEDRHEWTCPVAGCGRKHLSMKVRGVWKMDTNEGAVGIFV